MNRKTQIFLLVMIVVLAFSNVYLFNKTKVFKVNPTDSAVMGDADILMGMHPYDAYQINFYEENSTVDVIEFVARNEKECILVSYRGSSFLTLECFDSNGGDGG